MQAIIRPTEADATGWNHYFQEKCGTSCVWIALPFLRDSNSICFAEQATVRCFLLHTGRPGIGNMHCSALTSRVLAAPVCTACYTLPWSRAVAGHGAGRGGPASFALSVSDGTRTARQSRKTHLTLRRLWKRIRTSLNPPRWNLPWVRSLASHRTRRGGIQRLITLRCSTACSRSCETRSTQVPTSSSWSQTVEISCPSRTSPTLYDISLHGCSGKELIGKSGSLSL